MSDTAALVRALRDADFTEAPPAMLALAVSLFDDPAADLQILEEPALRLLAASPLGTWLDAENLEPLLERERDAIDHPLVHRVLRRTIVTDIRFEKLLVRLRPLLATSRDELAISVAMQAWNNEYVWNLGDEHRQSNAMYEPGHVLSPEMERQQIGEPAAEAEIAAALPPIDDEDDVTVRVRRQYEENPYPRWVAPPRPRQRPFEGTDAPRILVAGCGTGQEALYCAGAWLGARVTALDMSARSLAYGIRVARQEGLTNIDFRRATIAHAARWSERFDLIEAIGVLHHVADPEASWRALAGLLAPDGVMDVGLYSRDACAWIEPIRRRYPSRRAIVEANVERITRSADFYTTSGFRDLLFHEHELTMTLDEITAMVRRLRLRFVTEPVEEGRMFRFKVARDG